MLVSDRLPAPMDWETKERWIWRPLSFVFFVSVILMAVVITLGFLLGL